LYIDNLDGENAREPQNIIEKNTGIKVVLGTHDYH